MSNYTSMDYSRYQGSLHLYSDAVLLHKHGEEPYCVDPQAVTAALSGINVTAGPLPQGCLWVGRRDGQEYVGVLVPAQVWSVSVTSEAETLKVPLPPLVFFGWGRNYGAYALKGNDWPDRHTSIYHAPCPNVSGQHGVCAGSAAFPVAGLSTIWQAVEVFFESGFNDHLSNGKSRKHGGSVLAMWRELHQAKAKKYPVKDLIYYGQFQEAVNNPRGL